MKSLHEEIVYSTAVELVNSPAFYDFCIHLICNKGDLTFSYKGGRFALGCDDIAVISSPRNVSDIVVSEDCEVEYISAPNKFLHNLVRECAVFIAGGDRLCDAPNHTANSRANESRAKLA